MIFDEPQTARIGKHPGGFDSFTPGIRTKPVRMYPPTTPKPEEIILRRITQSKAVIVEMMNGNSYRLTPEQSEMFMRMIGVSERFLNEALTRLQNYYAVHIDVPGEVCTTIPRQDLEHALAHKERLRDEQS